MTDAFHNGKVALGFYADEDDERHSEIVQGVFDESIDPADVGISPFNTNVPGGPADAVEERQRERSELSREVDEAFNAPVTNDVETWRENPDEYDMIGVDTIPEDRQQERAERVLATARDRGDVDDVRRGVELDGGTKGYASYQRHASGKRRGMQRTTTLKVDKSVTDGKESDPRFQEPPVVAHELGHAVDHASGKKLRRELTGSTHRPDGPDETVREGARRLSSLMRGPFETADEDRKSYREDPGELFADAFAATQLQPRAALREAPEFVDELHDTMERHGLDDYV